MTGSPHEETVLLQTHLRAGVARLDITPEGLLPLEGYGARGGPATGTLDPLEAGALVLDDGQRRVALLCADLCGLEAPSVARVRRAVQEAGLLPADHLLVTYSHTHGAPAVTPFAGAPVDGAYLTWLEGRLALVVAEATRALQPVTVGVGEGSARLNVNRRKRTPEGMVMRANPQGAVDRRVRVLRLEPGPPGRGPAGPGHSGRAELAPGRPPGPPLLLPLPPYGAGGQQPALQRRLPRRRAALRGAGVPDGGARHRRGADAGPLPAPLLRQPAPAPPAPRSGRSRGGLSGRERLRAVPARPPAGERSGTGGGGDPRE